MKNSTQAVVVRCLIELFSRLTKVGAAPVRPIFATRPADYVAPHGTRPPDEGAGLRHGLKTLSPD